MKVILLRLHHNHHRTKKLLPIGIAVEQVLLVLESLLWVLDLWSLHSSQPLANALNISQRVELTPDCSLHDFCSKPLQYQFHQGATQCNTVQHTHTHLLCLVKFFGQSKSWDFKTSMFASETAQDKFMFLQATVTKYRNMPRKAGNDANQEFVYSMHCVPLGNNSRCFVWSFGCRFLILVRCVLLEKQAVEYCIMQRISEMPVSHLRVTKQSKSWTCSVLKCLEQWIVVWESTILTKYSMHLHTDTIWICTNVFGFVLKPNPPYPFITSVRVCSLPASIASTASRHESRCTCAAQMRWPPCADTTWHRLNHLVAVS